MTASLFLPLSEMKANVIPTDFFQNPFPRLLLLGRRYRALRNERYGIELKRAAKGDSENRQEQG